MSEAESISISVLFNSKRYHFSATKHSHLLTHKIPSGSQLQPAYIEYDNRNILGADYETRDIYLLEGVASKFACEEVS
jgi:hypothetical protein